MCTHDWHPDIDIATGEVTRWSCTHCPETRTPTRRETI